MNFKIVKVTKSIRLNHFKNIFLMKQILNTVVKKHKVPKIYAIILTISLKINIKIKHIIVSKPSVRPPI